MCMVGVYTSAVFSSRCLFRSVDPLFAAFAIVAFGVRFGPGALFMFRDEHVRRSKDLSLGQGMLGD